MKFCPRCGGLMMPVKKGNSVVLKCTRCGYEMPMDSASAKDYKAIVKSDEKRTYTTKTISKEAPVNVEENKEELEQAKEDYYEIVLDEMGEYGEQM